MKSRQYRLETAEGDEQARARIIAAARELLGAPDDQGSPWGPSPLTQV
jgi:hypothetical protein